MFPNKETYIFVNHKIMNYRFKVLFLNDAEEFLDELDNKSRKKVLYNIWKSRSIIDNELFKKLDKEIWEFRTLFNKKYIRLFAFWDKSGKEDVVVISTHGIIKKTGKTPKREIEIAERIRERYLKLKKWKQKI